MGLPNNVRAAMANKGQACWGAGQWREWGHVTMVTSSSSLDDVLLIGVGSEAGSQAEIKCLHLFAKPYLFAPHRQVFLPAGKTVLCIPFVHGSYPTTMNCCAFLPVNESWWFHLLKGHVMDVCPSSMLKPQWKHMFQLLCIL
jgi:hypothetical protein